jgi:Cu(I)/Ag(I) efflux system membrane fusion protein
MRHLWFVATVANALLLTACRGGAGKGAQAGDLKVNLALDPDPPSTGDNHLRVELRDAAGKPVDGARLAFIYDMPAMGAMPEMKGGGDVHPLGGGRYDVVYPLSMLGDWYLTLSIDAPGHPPSEVRLKVSPPRKGFTLERAAAATETGSVAPAGAGPLLELPVERQQLIGVTYATVEERPLALSLRAAGRIEVDERQVQEVTLKYEAYVQKLYVAETGKAVKAGDPFLTLYSPDLLAAEQELLQARRAAAAGEPGGERLLRGATQRLKFWDLTLDQIDAIARHGHDDGTLTIRSPGNGVVLEKAALVGMHAMPGTTLYRIGNLGRIWVQADVYELDAPHVAVGQPARMSLPSAPGQSFAGRVSFIAPTLDEKTRTLRARLEFANASLTFKPGMFADVIIEAPLGPRLAVPDRALLLSGEHRYAFVERGPGKLEPVEVRTGARSGDYDEVLSGLKKGDRVVLGAAFLVSSEAQLRSALPRWSNP